jgi:hypothetical protein
MVVPVNCGSQPYPFRSSKEASGGRSRKTNIPCWTAALEGMGKSPFCVCLGSHTGPAMSALFVDESNNSWLETFLADFSTDPAGTWTTMAERAAGYTRPC